jgi:hypothetical protein
MLEHERADRTARATAGWGAFGTGAVIAGTGNVGSPKLSWCEGCPAPNPHTPWPSLAALEKNEERRGSPICVTSSRPGFFVTAIGRSRSLPKASPQTDPASLSEHRAD